jgi:hypothetical protein
VVVNNPLIANIDTPVAVTTGDTTSIYCNDTADECTKSNYWTNPGQVTLTEFDGSSRIGIECKGTITVSEHSIRHITVVCSEVGATPAPPGNCDTASVASWW